MKDKIMNFFKDKRNILIVILDFFLSILITLRISNNRIFLGDIKTLNIWLLMLVLIFISYVFSHFLFKIKEIYNFIYKKRFLLSLIIFIILVLGKFNGSSLGMWDMYIQPSDSFSSNTIIGQNRAIRSDEWLVNTPYAFSQKYNNYEYYNDLARATDTDMYSSIFTPVADILILARPFNVGYLLFGEEYGLSIYWYGRLIALLLVTFEMCMLITNKRKLTSFAGAIVIAGSPLVSWFYSNYITDLLISGQLCVLMFNKFLTTNNTKPKILYSILIAFAFNWFALTLYPAWQIPLGYMYLMFAIWIIVKNWKNNNKLKDYKFLLITIILVGIMIGRYLMLGMDTIQTLLSTVYPGSRNVLGGGSTILNFVYPISVLFPVADYLNPCEASGVFSLFPIPIILSIVYLIISRQKKSNDSEKLLLVLLTILALIFTLFTMIELPRFLATITLLKMSPSKRVVPIIGIICAYLMLILLGKIEVKKNFSKIIILMISIVTSIAIVYIGNLNKTDYVAVKYLIIIGIFLAATIYLFLTSSNKRNRIMFNICVIFTGLLNLVLVNPVNIGTSITYEKDAAKAIRKIVKKDKEAIWVGVDTIILSNYVLMNGGKAINSTNIYPNMELWKRIDKSGEYEEVYNRYAHINILFTTEETSFELKQSDVFDLYLNYDDINKLDIDYVITSSKLELPEEYQNNFINEYHKDNIWIYKYES